MYEQFKPKYSPLLVETTLETGEVAFQVAGEPKITHLYPDTVLKKWGFPTSGPFKQTVELSYLKNRLFSYIEDHKKWFGLVRYKKIVADFTRLRYLVSDTDEKLVSTRALVKEWEQICFQMLCNKLNELKTTLKPLSN